MRNDSGHYVLATGARDVERLRLLQVVGIDKSPEQVEQARRQAEALGLTNVRFAVAGAYQPGLPPASFDLAYCRLVLMHLARPAEALAAMHDLVRPGGRVACEEMDLGHAVCDPPSTRMDRLFELNVALGERRGVHFRLGRSLHRLFHDVGLPPPELSASFPLVLRGETKRLLGMSFVEFAPALVQEGLAPQDEVDAIAAESLRLADDDTTLFGLPLIVQAWAVR